MRVNIHRSISSSGASRPTRPGSCAGTFSGARGAGDRFVHLRPAPPLALRILANAHADETQGEAERLLEDAIFGGLDPGLERALGGLAGLRKPIERAGLPGGP